MRLRRTGRAPRRLADDERRALELRDDIVQGSRRSTGRSTRRTATARAATVETLAQAQAMIGELLGDEAGAAFAPGSLRRRTGARGSAAALTRACARPSRTAGVEGSAAGGLRERGKRPRAAEIGAM